IITNQLIEQYIEQYTGLLSLGQGITGKHLSHSIVEIDNGMPVPYHLEIGRICNLIVRSRKEIRAVKSLVHISGKPVV
ncbi:MAG: hypothetical protein ACRD5J_13155, partial [Nitrososphaeraceae archaeon]